MSGKKKFSLGDTPPPSGLSVLLGSGPEETPDDETPPENIPQTPPPATQEDPMVAYEQRLVATYAARRNPLNITSAASPELKARLAVIARIAEDTVGSRQFTESSIIRALVELLTETDIDWRGEFGRLPPDLAARPVEAVKQIVRKAMNRS